MKIVITVKDTDNVIGLKEDIAMRLEGVTDIVRIDTADVAPKSEVAREIFKEMQSCLVMRHWHGHDILSFEFDAVKYAELKKKYTGEIHD